MAASVTMHDFRSERDDAGVDLTVMILLPAGLADFALLASWAAGILPGMIGLVLHLALTGAVGLLAVNGEQTAAVIGAVSLLVFGPVGAIGAIFITHRMRRARLTGDAGPDRRNGQAKSPRTDDASLIYEAVREGRSFAPQCAGIRRFADILTEGELGEKQALLGAITTRFHPDHLTVLKAALRSEEAPVRVLAAAVYTRLRETNRCQMTMRGNGSADREANVWRARELASAAHSGFLSVQEEQCARVTALGLLLSERETVSDLDDIEALLCTLLLRNGDHGQVVRRLKSVAGKLPPALKGLLLRARMQCRDYGGIAALTEVVDESADHHHRHGYRLPLLAGQCDESGAGAADAPQAHANATVTASRSDLSQSGER